MTTANTYEVHQATATGETASREIKNLQGIEIANHITELAELYLCYQEWPYLYLPDPIEEIEEYIIEQYANKDQGSICAIFENGKIIGIMMGMPMQNAKESYKTAFPNNEFPPRTFFLSDMLVHPDFRNLKLVNVLFEQAEQYVKDTGLYDNITLSMIERPADFPYRFSFPRPSRDRFYSSRGYKKLGQYIAPWKLACAPDQPPYPNCMNMWIKTVE